MTLIKEVKDETIRFSIDGRMTVYEAVSLVKEFKEYSSKEFDLILELGRVAECDTAGIQLLCSVIKTCIHAGKDVELINVPACVNEAAERIGLEPDRVISEWKADRSKASADNC